MIKILISVIACFLYINSLAQNYNPEQAARKKLIYQFIEEEKFYDAIREINYCLKQNPNAAQMYYFRGMIKYQLNDHIGARTDLIKAKNLDDNYNLEFVNYYTNKSLMVNYLIKYYLDSDTLLEENGFKPVFAYKDSLQGALRPERTCFDIYYYNLSVKILPEIKSIEGSNQIYFRTVSDTRKIQIDLAESYQLQSIRWNNKDLNYTRVFNAIFIDFDETLLAGENHLVTIKYKGKPRVAPSPPWNGGFVWRKDRSDWWVGVACEHLGASSWWPCKDHLTEKPDSMSVNIQVPTGYQAIANGNLRSTQVVDSEYSNFEWFVSYPINSYCVTFYMGKFVNFNEVYSSSTGSYNIDYYVLPRHLKRAKKFYSQTKDIVKVYEKLFGEYPYAKDGIAMVEAPYAGMEHQSAIAIGNEYGMNKRRGYEIQEYDYLLVHETAHEWWGNTVTMNDMADAWISEGFATYSEHLFMEARYGYAEYISASSKTMEDIRNIWPMVGIKDVNDNTFLGNDIYKKGAAMINNLRCTINNDSLFFLLIKSFYSQYKYKPLTTSQFIDYVNNFTSTDYSDFFNKFLYSAEPPVLQYDFVLQNDTLYFEYRWINVGRNFKMPFSITVNEKENIRIVGGVDKKVIRIDNVKSFYLPNEHRLNKDQIAKNSFTYYWTLWKPDNPFR